MVQGAIFAVGIKNKIFMQRLATKTFILVLAIVSTTHAQQYSVTRLNGENPVITQAMFTKVGVPEQGENINGPSVIRIPEWIQPENRAAPEAQYYLYFAHHHGEYIRMAWAGKIEGPWHLYQIGSDVPIGNRGVLDLGENKIYLNNGITIPNNHLASPDVHVDHERRQIIMYFHSGSTIYVNGAKVTGQKTFVATSGDGLHFYNNIKPVILGPSYFRVFKYNNNLYALTNDGTPYRAPDAEFPWTPPQGFDFKNNLWEKLSENPFQRDIADAGIDKSVLRVRHTAVRIVGDELHVFYSRRGDSPERIQLSIIDLSVADWEKWDSTYPPMELLKAKPGWEGGELFPEPSETGNAPENVNQLRDPFVFEDNDGSLYLFYTGRGEDAIGIAALTFKATDISIKSSKFPERFTLEQNFPNPFNASTTIKYSLPKPVDISLKVYNLFGQEVETLVNEFQTAGQREIVWQPKALSSGIYFYRLQAGEFSKTKKLVLQK